MSRNNTFDEAAYSARIDQIRARFRIKLDDRIRATDAALGQLTGNESAAINAVAEAYYRFHDILGISSTVGFEAIGGLARNLEAILVGPFFDHRGLQKDELANLKVALAALRTAVQTDMH